MATARTTRIKRDATDDAFIDDTDVAPEDQYGSDETSPVASRRRRRTTSSEAVRRQGRGGRAASEAAITSEVLNFLARMEVATEQDQSITAGRPAGTSCACSRR